MADGWWTQEHKLSPVDPDFASLKMRFDGSNGTDSPSTNRVVQTWQFFAAPVKGLGRLIRI